MDPDFYLRQGFSERAARRKHLNGQEPSCFIVFNLHHLRKAFSCRPE
jgi:hypothetical protein